MKSLISLLLVCVVQFSHAENKPEYVRFFDPAKGFKLAQDNLTNIYLQVAASLEHFGSPEPYLRHMLAEHERILRLAKAKGGGSVFNCRPAHMTDTYVEQLITNWNKLSPVLSLDKLAKEIGDNSRNGIRGVWDDGTLVVSVFNTHQEKLFSDITGTKPRTVGFNDLQAAIVSLTEFNNPHVNLAGYEVDRRDPVSYALIIRGSFRELRSKLEKTLPASQAKQIADAVEGAFIDLAIMAHSELEAGIVEWSLK